MATNLKSLSYFTDHFLVHSTSYYSNDFILEGS